MPVFRTAEEMSHSAVLLEASVTESDYCEVRRIGIPGGGNFQTATGSNEVVWFMVLGGVGKLGDKPLNGSSVVFALPGTAIDIKATETMDLLWTKVPQARRFDPDLATHGSGLKIVDWMREPVLRSEHDTRTRVYMATPALVGTGAIKAEMITYPPGAAAPEHHHEGAEHFQFIISGNGTAVLNGARLPLGPGDILYNFENELHYFFTDPDASEDFVFVEFFIPGHCKTVWAPEANACAWLPTGKDTRGDVPAREIGYHVHGQDIGI